MRKSVAAAAMAASLTVGGAAGAALFVPTLSGAQESDTPTTDVPEADSPDAPEHGAFLDDALAPLVDDGTISQEQADAVIAAIREARPEGGFRHHRGPGRLFGDGDVADVLGLTPEELRTALEDGKTLAEIAGDQGVDVQDVIDAIVANAKEHLDAAVADGRITQDEADEKLADITDHATALVNGELEFPGPRDHHDGPFGGADADDTTGA